MLMENEPTWTLNNPSACPVTLFYKSGMLPIILYCEQRLGCAFPLHFMELGRKGEREERQCFLNPRIFLLKTLLEKLVFVRANGRFNKLLKSMVSTGA